jgi:anti-sigma B factor antagonist
VINLYLNERHAGAVTILDLKGRLRIGGNACALHRSIRSLLFEKKYLILINFAGVSFIDSAGLGELVASQVSLGNQGGQIKLVGLSGTLRELFSATRLLQVFDTYDSEAEALESFAGPAAMIDSPQLALI